jgi:DNA-binding transcriptional ArsR family regulator
MSLEAMAWVLKELPKDLEPSSFKLLVYMADSTPSDGRGFYESLDTLSEDTGLSRSTIKTHLRKLIAAGYVRRGDQRITRYLGQYRPTVYDLCMPRARRSNMRSDRGLESDRLTVDREYAVAIRIGGSSTPSQSDGKLSSILLPLTHGDPS